MAPSELPSRKRTSAVESETWLRTDVGRIGGPRKSRRDASRSTKMSTIGSPKGYNPGAHVIDYSAPLTMTFFVG